MVVSGYCQGVSFLVKLSSQSRNFPTTTTTERGFLREKERGSSIEQDTTCFAHKDVTAPTGLHETPEQRHKQSSAQTDVED
jgi:hypothetical protein